MTTLKKVSLFLTITVVAALVIATAYEIIENIRYHRWKSRSDLGWLGKITIPSKNSKLMWEYKAYGKHPKIKTNRYGFRDYDFASPGKPDGTYRLAFIGDSVVLGLGVKDSRTFVRRFEIEGNESSPVRTIQALNFGIDGYNTLQVGEMLNTKVLNFSPDKVVYVMCLNDFDLKEASGIKGRYFNKPKSFLLERVEVLYRRLLKMEYHSFHFKDNKDVIFQEILRMRDLLAQNNTSFQVVIMPVFPHKHPVYKDMVYSTFEQYPLSGIHSEIAGFLEQNGIEVFDLLSSFRKQRKDAKYYANDLWHPNVRGHRFIARALLRPILDSKIMMTKHVDNERGL